MAKENLWNLVGVLLFYLIIILGVFILNAQVDVSNYGTNGVSTLG